MCDQKTLVPIPDLLWQQTPISQAFDPDHPEFGIDDQGRQCLNLDTCIVPAVQALWAAGIPTESCCCGHGSAWGVITIQSKEIPGLRGAQQMSRARYEELLSCERMVHAALQQRTDAPAAASGGGDRNA